MTSCCQVGGCRHRVIEYVDCSTLHVAVQLSQMYSAARTDLTQRLTQQLPSALHPCLHPATHQHVIAKGSDPTTGSTFKVPDTCVLAVLLACVCMCPPPRPRRHLSV